MKRSQYFKIRITRVGYLFILFCLGVGFASLNTGNNLLYLVFSMMLSFIILSGLLSNNTLQKVLLRPTFPHRIFAGEPVPVRIELENQKKRFPSFSLTLRPLTQNKASGSGAFVIKIPPGHSDSTVTHISFPARGHATLPSYIVETSFPFGFIVKSMSIASEGETLIYPKVFAITPGLIARQKHLGDFLSGQSGGTANPYGIRNLVLGDPARLIHWKSSARTGDLKVKQFEREKRLKILLDVELAPRGEGNSQLVEKVISLAASFVLHLTSLGLEVSLRVNGEVVRPAGRGYMDAYLRELALLQSPAQVRPSTGMDDGESTIQLTNRSDLPMTSNVIARFGPQELSELHAI